MLCPCCLLLYVYNVYYILCVHQALKRSLQTLELVDGAGIKRARKGSATATTVSTPSATVTSPVRVQLLHKCSTEVYGVKALRKTVVVVICTLCFSVIRSQRMMRVCCN
jgi:hypothetical protein